ncbi:putative disease resistance protein RGA4 [Primulina huaijiensis]|uniref:putative disease resistance protein RGA4 n=1 Tax=Primulina huaijiensis TaxID=1492673 RepID=UPI003CC799B2
MADAALLMLLSRLAPKLEKVVREEARLALNPNNEAQKLSSKLKKIQQVLMDAEQKAIVDPKVRSWLDKLQDISYDIEEVLDKWDLYNLKQESGDASESSHQLHKKVSSFLQSGFYRFKQSVVRHPVARNIHKLNKRLDLISKENEDEFKFIPNLSRETQEFRRIICTSIVDVSKVHGRDDDLKLLIKKLLPERGSVLEDDIHIVSIVGAGGMGKTTLAQLAFNDNTMKDHFGIKIWVCVSHPFDEIKIAKAILEAIDRKSPNLSQFESLLQSIKDSISGKRFLLVLDDVWTEDDTMWKPLHITLMENGAPGSRILVTTRNRKVAKIMGSTQMQLLDPLSDPHCWSILSQIAFHGRQEGDCEMLKEIGQEMAQKCKGMPLAAKTLGGLLRFKSSPQEWKNVLKSKVWEMDEVRTNIFPFIALSYNELHPAVKRCFSYCAIFPKDFLINVDDLIRIWMAHGFLTSSGIVGEMELKGREYFEDLAMRSFFQDFEFDVSVGDNRVEWCKMHDLVHDFAQSLTNNEFLIAQNDVETQNGVWDKNIRHFNLLKFEAKISMDLFSHIQTRKLCSFMCTENEIPLFLFSHLKRVKLLNLNDCKLKDVPMEIGDLIHVRYLNLGRNSIEKLPESICDLYNLQTLNLTNCRSLHGLPQGIQKLVNLRHLLVEGTPSRFTERSQNGRWNKNRRYIHKTVASSDSSKQNRRELRSGSVPALYHRFPPLYPLFRYIKRRYKPSTYTPRNLVKVVDVPVPERPFRPFRSRFGEALEFFGLSTVATSKPPSAFPKLMHFSIQYCKMLEEWDDIGDEEEDETIVSILPCLQRLEIFLCWQLKVLPHRLLRKAASFLQILTIGNCPYLLERYSEARGGEDWDKIAHIQNVYIR